MADQRGSAAPKTRDKPGRRPPEPAEGWHRVSGGILVYRGGQDTSQAWLLTFTDLAALMLTFFVLLFSMSTIKEESWQNLVDALAPRLPSLQEVTVALPTADKTADEVERVPGTDLDYLAAVLKEQMEANDALVGARVSREAESLVISMPGDLLFPPGAIELGDGGEKAVFALSGVLRNLRNVVEVAGHADPSQPQSLYPSNWELSLARAAAVSGRLTELGYQGSIVVRGYGAARYAEVDADLPAEERRARARRVDIVVHAYAGEVR
ncbi:flagellar motor protein MotB [Pelagibius sp. CAU 1746]|uniref:OmpA/MotB family protein n=1 Tax=Pelagibius sp. CAU 1746 TaxID=3140370 RepID=UPI00325A9A21